MDAEQVELTLEAPEVPAAVPQAETPPEPQKQFVAELSTDEIVPQAPEPAPAKEPEPGRSGVTETEYLRQRLAQVEMERDKDRQERERDRLERQAEREERDRERLQKRNAARVAYARSLGFKQEFTDAEILAITPDVDPNTIEGKAAFDSYRGERAAHFNPRVKDSFEDFKGEVVESPSSAYGTFGSHTYESMLRQQFEKK